MEVGVETDPEGVGGWEGRGGEGPPSILELHLPGASR